MTRSKSRDIETAEVRRFLMSANEALMEYKRIKRRVDRLSLQCEKLVRQGELLRPSERLTELWRLLEEERVREIEAVRHEMERYRAVEDFIAALPDPTARTILRRRYLESEDTWLQIRFRLERDGKYISERQVCRLHAEALRMAQEIFAMGEAVRA